MRRTVGLRELRADLTRILRRVSEEGEAVDVARRGRVIACIVPPSGAAKSIGPLGTTWADMDQLAAEIGRHWNPETISGPQVISASRRG